MKISEYGLKQTVKGIINELGVVPMGTMSSKDDRRFAVSGISKDTMYGDISQNDAVKLMSVITGFFKH